MTFKGYSSWGYRNDSLGSTIISPFDDDMTVLFNLNGSVGTRLEGLTLDGQRKGKGMHGVYSKQLSSEQNIVFEDCKIVRFSGAGLRLDNVWVFAIRHCLIQSNKDAGIDLSGSYDGFILDNQISDNGKGGIFGTRGSTLSITGNRIEWNQEGGYVCPEGGHIGSVQITGCTFDRNFGPGISIDNPKSGNNNTITGNIFRRNGFQQDENSDLFCHLLLKNVTGISVVGNNFLGDPHGKDKELNRLPSPGYGMILEGLKECVVVGNVLYHSALYKTIWDKGGHINSVIKDNPGSLSTGGLNK